MYTLNVRVTGGFEAKCPVTNADTDTNKNTDAGAYTALDPLPHRTSTLKDGFTRLVKRQSNTSSRQFNPS